MDRCLFWTNPVVGVPLSLSTLLASAPNDNILFSTRRVLVSSLLSHVLIHVGLALHWLCDNTIDPSDTSVIVLLRRRAVPLCSQFYQVAKQVQTYDCSHKPFLLFGSLRLAEVPWTTFFCCCLHSTLTAMSGFSKSSWDVSLQPWLDGRGQCDVLNAISLKETLWIILH